MTKVGIELILRGKVKRGFSGSISSVWLGVVLILWKIPSVQCPNTRDAVIAMLIHNMSTVNYIKLASMTIVVPNIVIWSQC